MPRGRELHDRWFRQAKRDGYVARSAYKLLELNDRKRLIRRGDRVIDLGCAPGSWLQVAAGLVGARGAVVGIDLNPIHPEAQAALDGLGGRGVSVVGDFTQTSAEALLDRLPDAGFDADGDEIRPAFDAVISDMAPSTTGHGDAFLSARLCGRVLDTIDPDAAGAGEGGAGLLRVGGSMTMKILEGEAFAEVLRRTKRLFDRAGAIKPGACRDQSTETYIWGTGLLARPRRDRDAGGGGRRTAGAPPKPVEGWGA